MQTWPLALCLILAGCVATCPVEPEEPVIGSGPYPPAAPFKIAFHENPEIGQYWETAVYWQSNHWWTERWCVVRLVEGSFIVERQQTLTAQNSNTGGREIRTAYAYLVDAPGREVNVLRAWIAEEASKPREVFVMEEFDWVVDTATQSEPFEETRLGRTFRGTHFLSTLDPEFSWASDAHFSEWWIADNGWFGGLIESTSSRNGNVESKAALTAMGTDGVSWINWDGVDIRPGYKKCQHSDKVVPR
jgi:hypothetical protein